MVEIVKEMMLNCNYEEDLEDLGIMGEILTSSGMKEVFLEGEHYKAMNTFHIVYIEPIKRL